MQVLDAPHLLEDFYLNLVDWSSQNILAVGLESSVYLWSATTSKVRWTENALGRLVCCQCCQCTASQQTSAACRVHSLTGITIAIGLLKVGTGEPA